MNLYIDLCPSNRKKKKNDDISDFFLIVPRIEPRALHMLDSFSVTESGSQPNKSQRLKWLEQLELH